MGNSYQFLEGAERLLDARAMFFYYATGITPAMSEAKPGTGSAYAVAFRDAAGNYFDGSRTYNITLPGPIPAKNFWAFTVYDNQTRSLLPTDQKTLVRTSSPGRSRKELGANHARQRLQRHSAPLWIAGTMVQQVLASRRP